MKGQLQFDEVKSIPKTPKAKNLSTKAVRDKWLDGFQNWCEETYDDDETLLGKCGFGMVCEYCKMDTRSLSDNEMCKRAFVEMIKNHKRLIPNLQSINYAELDYEDAWEGNVNGVRMTLDNEG